jgi:hypothetical protein
VAEQIAFEQHFRDVARPVRGKPGGGQQGFAETQQRGGFEFGDC